MDDLRGHHVRALYALIAASTCCIALLVLSLSPTAAFAIEDQYGLLSESTLTTNNPATGRPWQPGDTYRVVFHTSVGTNALSSDIEFYNNWVQKVANASTNFSISVTNGISWKVIGSTDSVDARDNTATNPNLDGYGEAIFLLDGTTVVATNYVDLWDGDVQHIINLTEQNTTWLYWPFTGTEKNGTKATGKDPSGSPLGGPGEVHQGAPQDNIGGTPEEVWVWRYLCMAPAENILPMYALSDPLIVWPISPATLMLLR